jgi:hypothetical protein
MSGGTNSPQEAVVKTLCDQSMSSMFVFCPDRFDKGRGRGTDEPADLAWVCNNCIILMYMRENKVHDNVEKNRRALRKAQEHNLSQAKRWLKDWKVRPLTGRNAHREFYMEHRSTTHIVVLSVIKGACTLVDVHTNLAAKHGMSFCATVPQSLLEELIRAGGSPVDLLILLQRCAGPDEMQESEAHRICLAYLDECYENSSQEINKQIDFNPADLTGPFAWTPWPTVKDPTHLVGMAAFCHLVLMKSRKEPIPGRDGRLPVVQHSNVGEEFGIFNDLGIADLYLISKALALGWHNVVTNDLMVLELGLSLAHYDCGLCVLASADDMETAKEIDNSWAKRRKDGAMRHGPTICYVLDKRHMFICASTRGGTGSHLESLLRNFAASPGS